jgi:hypothetical protein
MEYHPDLGCLKIFAISEETQKLSVHVQGQGIVAQLGQFTCTFPAPPDVEIPQIVGEKLVDGNMFQTCSIRFGTIDAEAIHNMATDANVCSGLYEDWSKISGPILCRECGSTVRALDLDTHTICLLPSATWGFEDMRVCEECGPLVVADGDLRTHRHEKKSRRKHVFVDELCLLVASRGDETESNCHGCGEDLSFNMSEDLQHRIRSVLPHDAIRDEAQLMSFDKRKVRTQQASFLESYSLLNPEASSFLEQVAKAARNEDNDSGGRLTRAAELVSNAIRVRVLSRKSHDVIVAAVDQPLSWGIRVMYDDVTFASNTNHELQTTISKWSKPFSLNKGWTMSTVGPIRPIILDL